MAVSLITLGIVALASLIGSFGAIYLKKGAQEFSLNPLKLIKNGRFIFGAVCYTVATGLYVLALRGEDLSVLYPLVSMTYIFISFFSIKLLNEKMSTWRWTGVGIIILGIVLIGLGS